MGKLLFISVLMLAIISGCKEDAVTEPEEVEITISGNVVDSDDNSIPDCNVILISEKDTLSTISESDGSFSFLFIDAGIDSVELKFINNNYEEFSRVIKDLSKENTTDLKIVLSKTQIKIFGVVTELDENGSHPSVNTKVTMYYRYLVNWDSLSINTNGEGGFIFIFDPAKFIQLGLTEIRIVVSKPDYVGIDTVIYNSGQNSFSNISLQITKKVNYFPTKVGNKWEYLVFVWDCETDYYSNKFEGTEIWEISTVESDGKIFTLDIYFTGTKKRIFQLNDVLETTYFENEKSSYNLQYNNGVIVAVEEGGAVPSSLKRINFLYPITESENGVIIEEYENGDVTMDYTLELNIGVLEYDYYDNRGWANEFTQEKLTLLSFIEGG